MGRVSRVVAVLAAVGMLFSGGGLASAAESAGSAPDGAPQCVPDRSTIAQCFPDKVLAQAIAYELKGDKGWTGAVLTSKDVKDTTYFSLYGFSDSSGISSVQGLQVFTNLTTLDLGDARVSDVSPLSKLVNLTWLYLGNARVSDVSPLSKLTNLKELTLDSTRVSDVSPLSKLVKLDAVDLDGTRVLDLSPLSKMNLIWYDAPQPSMARNVRPSVNLTVNADGSVSLPAPRWTDGTFVAPSSTSPAGGVLDAKRGVVTWKRYDAKASYSYNFAGGSFNVFSGRVTGVKPAASAVVMFRLYNPNSGEHFYTGNAVEKNHLAAIGWKYEGVGWTAPIRSGAPVFRLYNPYAGDHHYTLSEAERDDLVRLGWRYEGVGWYSAENSGCAPLYREYNPNARSGAHNYTLSKAENDMLVRVGWRYEGVAWYAVHA